MIELRMSRWYYDFVLVQYFKLFQERKFDERSRMEAYCDIIQAIDSGFEKVDKYHDEGQFFLVRFTGSRHSIWIESATKLIQIH